LDRWTQLELLVQIAETGSLSNAAEALDMSNAAVSRGLIALEERLNARLVERSTRRVALTKIGEEYYHQCKAILAKMKEADAAVNASVVNPSGMLRVTASLSFCTGHIAPLLPEFHRRYPNIALDIVAANRYFDLLDSGMDIAIRTREYEPDSNIMVRKLASTRRILAGSPAYFRSHAAPQTLEQLADHKLLIYSHSNNPLQLRFSRDGVVSTVQVKSLMTSNDGQIIRAAALEGLGILVQPNYIVYDDIVAGQLVPVLTSWDLPRLTVNIAYQSREHLPAKVRVFIDFIAEHFRQMDFERKWTK
jgi:DNA-binding transcriptional LysR family regulator